MGSAVCIQPHWDLSGTQVRELYMLLTSAKFLLLATNLVQTCSSSCSWSLQATL